MKNVQTKTTPFGDTVSYELVPSAAAPSIGTRTYEAPLMRPGRSVAQFESNGELWLEYTDSVFVKFPSFAHRDALFNSDRYTSTIIIEGLESYVIYKLPSASIATMLKTIKGGSGTKAAGTTSGYSILREPDGATLLYLERAPQIYQGYWVENNKSENYLRANSLIP